MNAESMNTERRKIRAAFSEAATGYDAVAGLQRRIARALANQAPAAHLILDAGAGTGFLADCLALRFPDARILKLDAAFGMCRLTPANSLCADLEALPLAADSIGLYCSSLAWQWARPAFAAREAARVLRPGGQLLVATLGPDTLHELRTAFRAMDDDDHVRSFDSLEAHVEALQQAGFANIRVRRSLEQAHAPDLRRILEELRTLGAHSLSRRKPGMTGRNGWQRVLAAIESFRQPAGLPVSYDVLILEGRKP